MFFRKLKVQLNIIGARIRMKKKLRSIVEIQEQMRKCLDLHLENDKKNREGESQYYKGQYEVLKWLVRDT